MPGRISGASATQICRFEGGPKNSTKADDPGRLIRLDLKRRIGPRDLLLSPAWPPEFLNLWILSRLMMMALTCEAASGECTLLNPRTIKDATPAQESVRQGKRDTVLATADFCPVIFGLNSTT
jgi:hypothetical protein